MSIVFLMAFIFDVARGMTFDEVSYEYMVIWALFSIADALWVKGLKLWEDKDDAENHA